MELIVSEKIIVVEDDIDQRMNIGKAFAKAAGSAPTLDFCSCLEALKIPFEYHAYNLAIVDFGPNPELASIAAKAIRTVQNELDIVLLAPTYEFSIPSDIMKMELGPLMLSDETGLGKLPGLAMDIIESGQKRSRGKVHNEDLEKRNRELREITDALARQSVNLLHLKNELSAEKSKIETIINGMGDGMMFFSVDGALDVINPVAMKIAPGYDKGKKLTLDEFIDQLNAKPVNGGASEEGRDIVYEAVIGGEIYKIRATYVSNADGVAAGTLLLLTNITREKEYERLKNDFSSMISHELRTPLTSISAAVDNLARGNLGLVTPDQKKFLDIIARNVKRQQAMIDDLLDLSKLETGQMKLDVIKTDVSKLILQEVEQYSLAFRDKNVELTATRENSREEIEADPNLITQVLNNLLSNALKFTEPGGRVEVLSDMVEKDGKRWCRIIVSDTGIGVSNGQADRIFDKYIQADSSTRRRYPGTGLGLAICKEIVEAHHGDITLESKPGEGSRFIILIPVKWARDNDTHT